MKWQLQNTAALQWAQPPPRDCCSFWWASSTSPKPGRTRRYYVPPDAARTIAALLALRYQVIAPFIAGVRSPRKGRKPITWTPVDCDYETLRLDLQTLFTHLGITTILTAAA